ncbi:MAG: hypothetical protein ACM3S0_10445 [Acidobacteriota bacterium]
MATILTQTRSTRFKIGWWILVSISAVSVVSNAGLILVVPRLVDSLIAWSTFSLYALSVLLVPYRRGEKWAWYLTWVLVIPFAVLGLNNPEAAPYYLTAAGLLAISQLLTRNAFF